MNGVTPTEVALPCGGFRQHLEGGVLFTGGLVQKEVQLASIPVRHLVCMFRLHRDEYLRRPEEEGVVVVCCGVP